jgi:hypothetical protein
VRVCVAVSSPCEPCGGVSRRIPLFLTSCARIVTQYVTIAGRDDRRCVCVCVFVCVCVCVCALVSLQ